LDNLARYIVPLITSVFKPPSTLRLSYDARFFNEILKREVSVTQRFPKNGIANYQLIHKPRNNKTPPEGVIDMFISDGFLIKNNVWRIIDKYIDNWEEQILY